jgi:hypothetical protein
LLAAQLVKAGLPAIFGPKTLVATFATEYTAYVDRCQASADKVEALLQRLTGQAWTLRVEASAAPAGASAALPAAPRPQQDREALMKDPLVQRAVELLGAQVLRIEPGFGQPVAGLPPPARAGGADPEES